MRLIRPRGVLIDDGQNAHPNPQRATQARTGRWPLSELVCVRLSCQRSSLGSEEYRTVRQIGQGMGLSEVEVMKQLDIESWRNLSKDKMLRFAALMPDMDTEVALKIIEQFPAFKEFALDTVKEIEKAHKSTLKSNDKSQKQVYKAFEDVREILKGELDKDDLTWDQRKFIIELIRENGKQVSQKDSENKEFLNTVLGKVAVFGGGAIAAGVVFLGGKIMLEQGDGINRLGA